MSNVLPAFQSEINTFSYDILWLAGHCLTRGKDNKAVIDVVNKSFEKYFLL